MAPRSPLGELVNQRQPRCKALQTYGRKKTRFPNSQHHPKDIFGDEDLGLTNKLKTLHLSNARTDGTDNINNEAKQNVTVNDVCDATIRHKTALARQDTENANDIDLLLKLSGADQIEKFGAFANKLSKKFQVEKIGEGSFAEVFRITSHEADLVQNALAIPASRRVNTEVTSSASSTSPGSSSYTSIIKVIPLSGECSSPATLERCSTAASVAHEVNILQQLDPIHGFTRFRGLRLVSGDWPISFLTAHTEFRKRNRKRAINAAPDRDFNSEQVYALIEMDDAGSEISLIKKPNVFQVWDIFWISTILLANAEECIQFEHRDLHMSNICVKSSQPQDTVTEAVERSADQDNGTRSYRTAKAKASKQEDQTPDIDPQFLTSLQVLPANKIGLSNLRVTIIDYTVARARLSEQTVNSPSHRRRASDLSMPNTAQYDSGDENIKFEPLKFTSDPFNSNSDDIEAYLQNLTYKKTRAVATLTEQQPQSSPSPSPSPPSSRPKPSAQRANTPQDQQQQQQPCKWRASIPRTNTIWLGYLLRVLIRRARGRTGKLNLIKAKTCNDNTTAKKKNKSKSSNSKLVSDLQESMWDVLLQVSRLINGDDYREIEDGNLPKFEADVEADGDLDHEGSGFEPEWTKEELDILPLSALDVLETAVVNEWIGAGEILAFRRVLEEENS